MLFRLHLIVVLVTATMFFADVFPGSCCGGGGGNRPPQEQPKDAGNK